MNKFGIVFLTALFGVLCIGYGTSYSADGPEAKQKLIEQLFKEVPPKDGVKEITCEQFQKIRNSGADYVLVDVLSPESYAKGHIGGAISFPVKTIDDKTVSAKLPKNLFVVVYCGSFQCHASTIAAKKLSGFGYKVFDYKGGLREWQERGNALVK
ncbi:MAG: rhodanese-like domain-containing protein [Candidatus Omnitrophica bacterium]|nr:rhodanese-like domain-containing protein [Candidatus Omnitrophota bacterium]